MHGPGPPAVRWRVAGNRNLHAVLAAQVSIGVGFFRGYCLIEILHHRFANETGSRD